MSLPLKCASPMAKSIVKPTTKHKHGRPAKSAKQIRKTRLGVFQLLVWFVFMKKNWGHLV